MLRITIPAIELYDEETNTFFNSKEQVLQLEHSLISLSKWESKWLKPFLSKEEKTIKETIDYIRCMNINQNVDENVYNYMLSENVYKNKAADIINQIREYIDLEMTATTFSFEKKVTSREIITAEIIYYWMIAMNIPFECQKWHLNRLLTLINVCNIKNTSPKKMSRKEINQRNSALNAARKKALRSGG